MQPFSMALPRTVEEALKASEKTFAESRFLAGGTDLLQEIKEGTARPPLLVNLKGLPGLRAIEPTARGLEIGALVTLAEVAANAHVRDGWPALVDSIERAATPQVRNAATIAGNLCQRPRCWYYRDESYACLKKGGARCYAREGENEYHAIFDNDICCAVHPSNLAPVLIAHGALVQIVGTNGERSVAAEEFFTSPRANVTVENQLQPGEVITRVILPGGSESKHAAFVEVREKQSFDWALCLCAVRLEMDGEEIKDLRIVFGALAPTPLRRPDLEGMLKGKKPDAALMEKVAEAAVANATPLANNRYKLALARVTLKRALAKALA